jgi:hypothetical protein
MLVDIGNREASMSGWSARACAAAAACALLAACGSAHPVASPSRQRFDYTRQMPSIAVADWSARGTVLTSSAQTPFDMAELPAGSTAHTMVYRSVSGITGAPTVVSGAVFTPPGNPPPDGWPVVGYAHGTVGVTADCAPTGDPRLFGDLTAVAIQLQQGYAVAFTDYAGLGKPAGFDAPHAYLEPKSAAFNLIDAVRAARTVQPQLSSRWLAMGASQGGETAWAAAEYFASYGLGTDLLGAAAMVPTLDLTGLVARAQAASLTVDQTYIYPGLITGLAAVDKSILPDDYLHGELHDDATVFLACHPPASDHRAELAAKIHPSDARPSSAEAAQRLTVRLGSYALPQQPTKVPLLVVYGGADRTVLPEWTEVAMGRACALGDTIMRVRMDNQGHTLDPGAPLGRWQADRFADAPAAGNC